MTNDDLALVEIVDINDDLLLPWLDLYETAFPPNEKLLVSNHLQLIKDKMQGQARDDFLLAAVDKARELVGIMRYELSLEHRVAYLWYLAVLPQKRGKGLGARLYRQLISRLDRSIFRALVFEVEIPEEAKTEEEQSLARRRIEFYHRLGARRLNGIHYLQSVGAHQPVTPMHIMIHPLQPTDADTAFALARDLFGASITQVGPLTLS